MISIKRTVNYLNKSLELEKLSNSNEMAIKTNIGEYSIQTLTIRTETEHTKHSILLSQRSRIPQFQCTREVGYV